MKIIQVDRSVNDEGNSLRPTEVVTSIYKQTKNRNETGSKLSLGTRLTVLSKRLGRKRHCDATPDRCLGGVSSHYLRIVKKCVVFFQKIEGFWLDPRD